MIFVPGYCGLRFGEAAALKVADVDIAGAGSGCGAR